MSQAVWSVGSLLQFIKLKLDNDPVLTNVWVKGELSNFTAHRSGHWYFTIKDENARIGCVMFSNHAGKVGFIPKEGDKVLLRTTVSLYPAQGQMQLYVTAMQHEGLGDLYQKFEALKKKLFDEGLFEASRKKPIPVYPSRIGVISGKDTAALQDILSTLKKRWPIAEVRLYYSLVQGAQAASQIIERLHQADHDDNDVLILARGGGSIEDLWPFNEESVARKIVTLKTPLIAGIGHETDVTIADLVSDMRSPTPTGAAQAAVRDQTEVRMELNQLTTRAYNAMKNILRKNQLRYQPMREYPVWQNPDLLWQDAGINLTMATQRFSVASTLVAKQRERLSSIATRLTSDGIKIQRDKREVYLKSREILLTQASRMGEKERYQMAKMLSLLNALSPLAILERGYAIPYIESGILKSVDEANISDSMSVRLHDGTIYAQIVAKEKNNE